MLFVTEFKGAPWGPEALAYVSVVGIKLPHYQVLLALTAAAHLPGKGSTAKLPLY